MWFDLDDTVWDMTGNSDIALRALYDGDEAVRRAYGTRGFEAWSDCYHAVNARLWRAYDSGAIDRDTLRMERFAEPLQAAGLSRAEAEEASRRLDGDYLRHLGNCPGCIAGAREAVEALRVAGVPIGIVSNGFREVQYRKLRSAGLEGVFDPIVLSDDVGINKPDARFFAAACRAAGVAPGQCVIVGDNARTDIAGALDAGWAGAVWYDNGRTETPAELRRRLTADPRCVRIADMALAPRALGLKGPAEP